MYMKKYALALAVFCAQVACGNQINLHNAYGVQKKIAAATNDEGQDDLAQAQDFDDEEIIEMGMTGEEEIDMKELAPNGALAWVNEHVIAHFFVLYNWFRHRYEAFKLSQGAKKI